MSKLFLTEFLTSTFKALVSIFLIYIYIYILARLECPHNCSLDFLYQNFTKGLYDQILKLQTAPLLGHKWNLKFLELNGPPQNINLVHSVTLSYTLSLSLSLKAIGFVSGFVGDDNSSIKNDNNFETKKGKR